MILLNTYNLFTTIGKNICILFFITLLNQAAHAQTFDWSKSYGGASGDYCYAMTVDNYGNVYNTGTFIGTADMDPGVGVYNLIANNGSDFYISKLDSSGNFIWAKNITGVNSAQGLSVKIDKNDNIIVADTFTSTNDFYPISRVFNMTDGVFFIFKFMCIQQENLFGFIKSRINTRVVPCQQGRCNGWSRGVVRPAALSCFFVCMYLEVKMGFLYTWYEKIKQN